ncbi:hypothetical protein [Bradyrhizobium sp. AZCC 2289]|uniref:hypothetical protein n=1 Tax=Bradyrhizobium sp. AZCC 2289 TaxID=3117026 RepID=UPI002FF243FA
MTQSKMKREIDEAERAMIATDRAGEYLYQNHRDHAAEIAMRVMYRLALIWKIERDCRLIRDRDDPRLAFHITNEYVHRVHNKVAELPSPSQSDAIAEYHVMALLAEFEPDRAWLTAHNIYHTSVRFPPHRFPF